MPTRDSILLSAAACVPTYTLGSAAHYVGVPAGTLRNWVLGWRYSTAEGEQSSKALIVPADAKIPLLSFTNLIEAHVLSAIRKVHKVKMHRVRPALDYVERQLGIERPLANESFRTDGASLFIERLDQVVDASARGQPVFRTVLESHLERVEWDHDLAARLFPFSRSATEPTARLVMVSPVIAFGRLAVAGTGVPTATVAGRFIAGESIDELARDYGIDSARVQEALRWEIPQMRTPAA